MVSVCNTIQVHIGDWFPNTCLHSYYNGNAIRGIYLSKSWIHMMSREEDAVKGKIMGYGEPGVNGDSWSPEDFNSH